MTALVVVLAGCSARTTGATNVGQTTATLTASGDCSGSSSSCSWYFKWGRHGTGYDTSSPIQGPVASGWSGNSSYQATTLTPETTYDFQVCGYAQGQWQGCFGPDGTANTHGEFTTAPWTSYLWYQSNGGVSKIATDANRHYADLNVGSNYLTSSIVDQNNGVAAGSGHDQCVTNGTGRMATPATNIGNNGLLTGLSVNDSSYEITTATDNNQNPLCQAALNYWGFYMNAGHCDKYCNMQHAVSFYECNGSFSCKPWSSSFPANAKLILAGSYNAYTDCTNVNGCQKGYHAYMCMRLADTSKPTHPQLEYCVETWRPDFVKYPDRSGTARFDSAPGAGFYETVSGGANGLTSWTRVAPGTAYATKCTVASCGLSSNDTITDNTLGLHSYAVSVSASQLRTLFQDANPALGTNYSTNASDYALVGLEHGNESDNVISGTGYLGSHVESLVVSTVW